MGFPRLVRARFAVCAEGQAAADREFNLAAADADVLQRTIIEALEAANGAAPASLRGHATRELPAAQDEHAQPFGSRAHGRAHVGLDDEIALDRGLPVEFVGRERRDEVVFFEHGRLLQGGRVDASSRLGVSVASGSTWRDVTAAGATGLKERFVLLGIFLEIFWRMRKRGVFAAGEPKQGGD